MKLEVYTGVVLLDFNFRIFLIKENDKNKIGKGRWNLPGGSLDREESLIDSAQREASEETGYDVKMDSLVGCYYAQSEKNKWLYIVFKGSLKSTKRSSIIDRSVKEGRWFSKDEFLNMKEAMIVHSDMKLVYNIALENKGLNLESVKFIDYAK